MSYPTHLHNVRADNGRFAKKPVAQAPSPAPAPAPAPAPPPQRQNRHMNAFLRLSDQELLRLTPRKFRPLAALLCAKGGARGYDKHRRLLCTYLQAAHNLTRLESLVADACARRDDYYGVGKVMHTLKPLKLMDLYRICQLNDIAVPFGASRTQMLEWLEARAHTSGLITEAQEPSEAQAGLGDGGKGDHVSDGHADAKTGMLHVEPLDGKGD